MKDLFEGVYLKHQKNGESICFIAGRAGETRFVQVITNGTVRQYDGAQGFCFGEEGVAAELPGVQGAVRYGPLSPLRTDIMGPFRFLPMQCSHSVYSMAHTLAGGFTVDGRFIDLTGGTGYIEGDRGSAFPRDYLWVQCNDFAQPCSVMASVAHIPFCGRSFTGCICAVVYRGREYRLATYRGVRIVEASSRRLVLRQGRYLLEASFAAREAHPLRAPRTDGMTRTIRECNRARARFRFWEGGGLVFDLCSERQPRVRGGCAGRRKKARRTAVKRRLWEKRKAPAKAGAFGRE